jgi:hypothetical protein
VRLVGDHHIPLLRGQLAAQGVPPRRGDRGKLNGTLGGRVGGARREDGGRERELAFELLAPLLDQASRGEHQHAVGQTAHAQLGQDQPGLDGLAEPHLIREDRPAPHAAQHRLRGAELVVEGFERERRQGQEGVEAGLAPDLHGAIDQR